MSALPLIPNPADHDYTPEEYFCLERDAAYKSEYLNGKIYAMAGASPAHGLISMNVSGSLWIALRGKPCRVYGSDLQIKVEATGLYTYPDLSIVCEPERYFEGKNPVALLNPRVLIEILSDSTERYDRGRKFDHYRQIPSLQEYVLISQTRPQVALYTREGETDDVWTLRIITKITDRILLRSINVTLAMNDIYEEVTLPSSDTNATETSSPDN